MKQSAFLVNFAVVVVMISAVLAPAAVPFIEPRVTVRTLFICRSQMPATVIVMDAQGRTYTQACGTSPKMMLGYPGISPTEDAPWVAIITVQPAPGHVGHLKSCGFHLTRVPMHFQCTADGAEPPTVDFDISLMFDLGGMTS